MTEAEYIAILKCIKKIIYLWSLLEFKLADLTYYCDDRNRWSRVFCISFYILEINIYHFVRDTQR